jgi:hypothetical protein
MIWFRPVGFPTKGVRAKLLLALLPLPSKGRHCHMGQELGDQTFPKKDE